MVRDKIRMRFRKVGDLRLVSHHDLMRCFERMLRRADLPFLSSEGFNPKPRMVFALPLPLGVVGHEEIVELLFDGSVSPEDIRDRLARQAPAGLEILSAERVDPRETAQVRRATYRLALPPERRAELPPRLAALLAEPHCWVERPRPQPRRLDVRASLADLRLGPDSLEIDLCSVPGGTARADEIVQLLGLRDLLDAGAVIERTYLELVPATAPPEEQER